MRVLVFFDLPVETSAERREYTKFRKYLIRSGFAMMQESVYVKMTLNAGAAGTVVDQLKRNKPKDGIVQAMVITEKQFSRIEYIVGQMDSEVISSDERTVFL